MHKTTTRLIVSFAFGLLATPAAWAATISWATVASGGVNGSIAAPKAGANAVTVIYNKPTPIGYGDGGLGQMNWNPAGTWADGAVVANAPVNANGVFGLDGGNNVLNTVTFSEAVVNPVMAIYSLGGSGVTSNFVFNQTPTFVVGGSSTDHAGKAITVSGKTVTGLEANGTIQFIGTYTQLSWTSPQYEHWSGFNVGIVNTAAAAAVPEPTTAALLALGLLTLGHLSRRRLGTAANANYNAK